MFNFGMLKSKLASAVKQPALANCSTVWELHQQLQLHTNLSQELAYELLTHVCEKWHLRQADFDNVFNAKLEALQGNEKISKNFRNRA